MLHAAGGPLTWVNVIEDMFGQDGDLECCKKQEREEFNFSLCGPSHRKTPSSVSQVGTADKMIQSYSWCYTEFRKYRSNHCTLDNPHICTDNQNTSSHMKKSEEMSQLSASVLQEPISPTSFPNNHSQPPKKAGQPHSHPLI